MSREIWKSVRDGSSYEKRAVGYGEEVLDN